jgi:hypothetical protein
MALPVCNGKESHQRWIFTKFARKSRQARRASTLKSLTQWDDYSHATIP